MITIELEVDKSFLTKAAIICIILGEFILIRKIQSLE